MHLRNEELHLLSAVRHAVARHLHVPVQSVLATHLLRDELGIDELDLAFVAVHFEDVARIDPIEAPELVPDASVADLAVAFGEILERRAPLASASNGPGVC